MLSNNPVYSCFFVTASFDNLFEYYNFCFFRFNVMGSLMGEDDDDQDQDSIKEAFLETNFYLLVMTFVVSILHTIFEFLAFKNGKHVILIRFSHKNPHLFIDVLFCFALYQLMSDQMVEIYIKSAPNNSNETYTFMCLGRAGHFGQC